MKEWRLKRIEIYMWCGEIKNVEIEFENGRQSNRAKFNHRHLLSSTTTSR